MADVLVLGEFVFDPRLLSAGWREAFSFLPAADIDSMVADVIERIRTRRRETEADSRGACLSPGGGGSQ